jgi:hypothetical protein
VVGLHYLQLHRERWLALYQNHFCGQTTIELFAATRVKNKEVSTVIIIQTHISQQRASAITDYDSKLLHLPARLKIYDYT